MIRRRTLSLFAGAALFFAGQQSAYALNPFDFIFRRASTTLRPYRAPSIPRKNYLAIVENLKPGDTVEFSNYANFKIIQKLPATTLTYFLLASDANGKMGLLRMARPTDHFSTPTQFVKATSDAAGVLDYFGVPHAQVFDHNAGEYAFVDYVPDATAFEQAFQVPNEMELEKRIANLKRFWEAAHPFAVLGDFVLEQITYSPSRGEWILLDWSTRHIFNVNNRPQSLHVVSLITSLRSGRLSEAKETIPGIAPEICQRIAAALEGIHAEFDLEQLEKLRLVSSDYDQHFSTADELRRKFGGWQSESRCDSIWR